jgi:hypothetical protein
MLSNLNQVGKHYYDNGVNVANDTKENIPDSPTSPVVVTNDNNHEHLD